MSGHSKFANIKHKKEKNDAAKGKIFTIIGREIAVAVKEGGADPANNSRLRDVIAKAKANNMPNDTITRGIKKASGDAASVNYEYVVYEGYGPSGTTVQRQMSEMHLQKEKEISVHRVVYLICLIPKDRSLLQKKIQRSKQMI